MTHPVLRKLEAFLPLPAEDKALAESVIALEKCVPAQTDLMREGDEPTVVHMITSGFACRYKRLAGGKRQIAAFLIPGDFTDPYAFILTSSDHSIMTLAPSMVAEVPRETILEMLGRPALANALHLAALADSATLREWIVTIGQRRAESRIGHLFCEVHARLRAVGLVSNGTARFPINQIELGNAVGLSQVHTSRSLRSLRDKNLISFSNGNLKILDATRLEELCGFKSNYLHLPQEPQREPIARSYDPIGSLAQAVMG